jgi:hypothetical protein
VDQRRTVIPVESRVGDFTVVPAEEMQGMGERGHSVDVDQAESRTLAQAARRSGLSRPVCYRSAEHLLPSYLARRSHCSRVISYSTSPSSTPSTGTVMELGNVRT